MTGTAAGRTREKLMAAAAYSSIVGVPLVTSEGRRVANTALPDMPKAWDELKRQAVIDAAFIAHAWNCHDDLVKALEECGKFLRDLTDPDKKASGPNIIATFGNALALGTKVAAALAAAKTGSA